MKRDMRNLGHDQEDGVIVDDAPLKGRWIISGRRVTNLIASGK